jgi:hypothetical protein
MADRPTVTTVAAGAAYSSTQLNNNFTALRNAFDDVLGRAGTSGSNNTATGALDMNGYAIRNAVIDNSTTIGFQNSFQATSSTSTAIGTGSKTFTVEASKGFLEGMYVLIVDDASASNWMYGQVTSLVVDVQLTSGSGTIADWLISVSGVRGATGATGATGPVSQVTAGTGISVASTNSAPVVSLDATYTSAVIRNVTANLTAGYTATANPIGTVSSGTTTPDPTTRNFHYYTNNGAHTLGLYATGDFSMVVQVTNGASAGAITTSAFTKTSGSALTTTNGDDFLLWITKCNGFSHLNVQALQ